MKNWDKNERPDFMDIAYTSERSIEDEIERLSEGEILTTVISYLVMFVYITIALGRIRSASTLFVSVCVLVTFYKRNYLILFSFVVR